MMQNNDLFYQLFDYDKGSGKEAVVISSHRALMKPDSKYYCLSFIGNFTSPALSRFLLGIDCPYPGFKIHDRCENSLIINFVLNGSGTVNGIRFSQGDCYYLEPMQQHTIIADSQTGWQSVWLTLGGTLAEEIIQRLHRISDAPILRFRHLNDLKGLAEYLIFHCNFGSDALSFCKACAELFLSYLDLSPSDSTRKYTSHMKEIVSNAIKQIQKEVATVTVTDLANAAFINRKYFTQVFSAVTGMSPQEYIIDYRINLTKNYLLETNLSVSQIVEAVGYRHRNSLELAFRKKFNCSPTEFRNQKNHRKTGYNLK